MSSDLHLEVAARLRRVRQRYTPQRRALAEALSVAGRPLSIPELLADGGFSQSSVYRNLGVLERAGVVRRVVASDEFNRFELVEDLTGHHHHLICAACGAVADFEPTRRLERALAQAAGEATRAAGFTADHHRVDLIGFCGHCA